MNNLILAKVIRESVKHYPGVIHHLTGRARWIAKTARPVGEAKTQGAYFRQIQNRIRELYTGEITRGDFLDAMAEMIQEQLTRAFRQALRDNDLDPDLVNEPGEGFQDELESMILSEYDYVDGFADDIEKARGNDQELSVFDSRAEIWANRYTDAYNQAEMIIGLQMGGKLKWELGNTEEHCETCDQLNGIVAYAHEWESAAVHPQTPPNPVLDCGGWRCDCSLTATDQRRSPRALETIMNIVNK